MEAPAGGGRTTAGSSSSSVSMNQSDTKIADIAATAGPVTRATSSRLVTPGRKSLATILSEPA